MFQDEKTMVDKFIKYLERMPSLWGEVKIGTEFNYQRGRTDIIVISDEGNVMAFEAKLNKWKIALQQAYRNRCFADLSYVILPEKQVYAAYKNKDEFIKRGVGLCYISEDSEVKIVYDAKLTKPLQLGLRHKALLYASNEGYEDAEGIRECS